MNELDRFVLLKFDKHVYMFDGRISLKGKLK